ncbi:MAG: type II toxin-antitoxin system HigA family antitoxin [Candidatus Methylacidiphilales bacterium]|nr:transcriptional regulator [Candidatus Methylacidiphilales bacterium]
MTPKLIKTEAEYREALARLGDIFLSEAGTPEGDEAELLAILVEHYEEKVHPIPQATPLAMIRFRMDQQSLSPADLVPFIGSLSRVNSVLEGKLALTLPMVKRLAPALKLPVHLLLSPSEGTGKSIQALPVKRNETKPESKAKAPSPAV